MISSAKNRGRTALLALLSAMGVISLLALTAWSDDRVPFPKPPSHKGGWVDNHGIEAQVRMNEPGQTGKSCLICHEKNDCITCHATRPPRDHTNYWRTSGHGMTASVNRERCLNCHREDYCVRCHNETAPRSHRGNWASQHCTWCHYGSSFAPAENCVVCHRRALHTSAPHNVSPQLDCTQCHN